MDLDGSLDNSLRNSLNRPAPDPPQHQQSQASIRSSSSYTLASDQSVFSRDVEHWIRGGSTETTGVQGNSGAVRQRSTLATNDMQGTGFWYILAFILPLFSFSNSNNWRCSPRLFDSDATVAMLLIASGILTRIRNLDKYLVSTILNTAEFFVTQVGRVCSRVRCQIRRLGANQVSRELFAAAMDVVLIIYAIGFLILSMYQASIID